jgi:hypothetical protein
MRVKKREANHTLTIFTLDSLRIKIFEEKSSKKKGKAQKILKNFFNERYIIAMCCHSDLSKTKSRKRAMWKVNAFILSTK